MRRLRLFLFLVVGVLLGGGCSIAVAASKTMSATSLGMGMNVRAPADVAVSGFYDAVVPGFDWTYDPYSSADTKISRAAHGSVGGAPVSMSVSRVVSAANVAKAAVKLAKLAGPVSLGLTLADLIWDELSQQWMKPAEGLPQQTQSGVPGVCYSLSAPLNQVFYDAVGQACVRTPSVVHGCSGDMNSTWNTVNYVQDNSLPCGWSAVKARAGYVAPAPQTTPATDAEIEDAIYVELVARGMSSDLARRLVDAGYAPDLLPGQGPTTITGPASVSGPSSTSTTSGPSGMTMITNITNYNFDYSGQTVNVTENTTTTKTNPDNTTETTTETKTPAPTAGDPPPLEEPPQTDCEKFPKASGCEELGDPQDEQLQEETENVSWSAEGGAAGSCPAPKAWNTQFGTYMIEWTPVCDFASGIRPFVIGIAWLGAGLFIFMVAKEKA